jgi:SAM-dependent methyltransferase
MTEAMKRVLDPCCGSRMFWFDRRHPDVVYGDRRHETLTVTDRSHGREDGQRTLHIDPDVLLDFRDLPYPDGSFSLVVFDPPHLVRAGPKSWLAAKYGKLGPEWRDDLRAGFAECFRVLADNGVLIFKWNETQVKVGDILALTDIAPLFGHPSGRKGLTHWIVFMKPAQPALLGQEGACDA